MQKQTIKLMNKVNSEEVNELKKIKSYFHKQNFLLII